jgi:hypothetical protein
MVLTAGITSSQVTFEIHALMKDANNIDATRNQTIEQDVYVQISSRSRCARGDSV